jgi:hypothetical protein
MTLRVAQIYYDVLREKGINVHLLSLKDLNVWEENEVLFELEKNLLIPTKKFIFIMPEYNGSFPGILKLLLDNTDIKTCWWHKKVALVGLASGRGGNLRGIEHMTNILHYLKMNVHYNKLPISRIEEEMSQDGKLLKPLTQQSILQQIDEFINY